MRLSPLLAAAALLLALTGCAQAVPVEPAADAENPQCADVVVRLPDTVPGRSGDLDRHETNSQGTGAWGTPSVAILSCGVAVPDPTSTLICVSADGVDWLLDESKAPSILYTTYGRDPAVQVIVNQDEAAPGAVLFELASAVKYTEKLSECTEVADSL